METEDLAFNNGSEWEVIKEFGEHLPHISIAILTQTLIIETITIESLNKLVSTLE